MLMCSIRVRFRVHTGAAESMVSTRMAQLVYMRLEAPPCSRLGSSHGPLTAQLAFPLIVFSREGLRDEL